MSFFFLLQDIDSPYEDDVGKDPDYDYLDDIDTSPISEKLHLTVQLAMRFNNSAEQTMLIINSLLKELNRDDLMLSASGIRKLKKRLGDEAIKKRECEDQGLVCLKFDGKKGATKQPKNKTKSVDNYTVIKEPNPRYVSHFVPTTSTGKDIALGVLKVIHDTKSARTIKAGGAGKFYFIFYPFYY